MIGEGTDIKPISVIVKADLVRALSKTMQQVFRGMRYRLARGSSSRDPFYIPDAIKSSMSRCGIPNIAASDFFVR
jgi:hypothetical protein